MGQGEWNARRPCHWTAMPRAAMAEAQLPMSAGRVTGGSRLRLSAISAYLGSASVSTNHRCHRSGDGHPAASFRNAPPLPTAGCFNLLT